MMILFTIVLIFVGLTAFIAFILLKVFTDKPTTAYAEEESRLVQEMHRTLTRLEERVDALETILNGRNS